MRMLGFNGPCCPSTDEMVTIHTPGGGILGIGLDALRREQEHEALVSYLAARAAHWYVPDRDELH